MQNTTLVNPDILRTPWCDTNAHATPCRARAAALGIGATALVTTLLFLIPGRAAIAPIIEADNAYIFLAADRLYEGQGLTTIPPRAPLQAWTWRSDWVFLTQWPVGYPLLLCGTHALLGVPTAQAAQMLAVVCCGIALVAWFVWVRSCLPRGVLATLIALVAAGATFSMQNLVNPASDTVLLALVPVVLLLFRWALPCGSPLNDGSEQKNATSSLGKLALVGFVAGLLFWVRYAAIFVPIALGSFLLMRAIRKRGRGVRDLFAFSIAGLIPIAGLVILNRTFGPNVSTQEQLNLGSGISWHVSTDVFAMAWKNFAQQTPYAYRPEASAFYLWILPLIAITIPLLHRPTRMRALDFWRSAPVRLSAYVTLCLLGMLVFTSVVFAGKFNYVGLARYYQPIRPFYYLLLLGPLTLLANRWIKAAACVPLILAGMWFVNQDARRAEARMLAHPVDVTDYGRVAQHFPPDAEQLFRWLREQASDRLVVFSNFHEEIALETHIPACPVPKDPAQLDDWLARIRTARGVQNVQVLFVLNPDNDYRDYYLDPPHEIIEKFDLVPLDVPQRPSPSAQVFTCSTDRNATP